MDPIVAHLGEELFIPLLATEEPDDKHPGPVDGEQGPDTVEFAAEDLEHDEGKGELRQSSANIGAFKRSLSSPDFDNFIGGQRDGASTVHAETVSVSGAAL